MLNVDRSIAITLLNRAWALFAGPATLMIVAIKLTPVEQGYYFAFSSILGLQVFFELGLGFVLMQTVSHLMAKLKADRSGVYGDLSARAWLGRLFADVLLWYSVVAFLFILLISLGGAQFFCSKDTSASVIWLRPWVIVVPIFGMSIIINAVYSILEGLGFVADVALARLLQSFLGILGLWIALMFGQRLMSLAVLHGMNLAIGAIWITSRYGLMLREVLNDRGRRGMVNWRADIWSFQWRIAVSWTSGYWGTQLITLILFQRLNPVDAGRFGLTLAATTALTSGAMAWITTKAPRFGALVASKAFEELNELYSRASRGAMMFGIFGAVLLFMIIFALNLFHHPLVQRFVPLPPLFAMTLASLVSIRIASQASFLRSFRREPYLRLSIVIGISQVIIALIMTVFGNISLVAISYAAVTIFIGLVWAPEIFASQKRELLAKRNNLKT